MKQAERWHGQEHIERLRDSENRFGQIHPVIEAADGDVISGEHRLKANPKWRREKRPDIKDPFDKIAFKLAANTQRTVDAVELKHLVHAAWIHWTSHNPPPTMRQFADVLGVSVNVVRRYGADLFPNRPEGNLILPEGTVVRGGAKQSREKLIANVETVPLKVQLTGGSLQIYLPRIITRKYDISGGETLVAVCKKDCFIVKATHK